MRHISFPADTDTFHRRLPFFLATEEWAARYLPAGDYFFSWQVSPTVICGRNQEIDKEVNLGYCAAHGIDVVRRRSGGGCVFADRQNFMFSFITDSDHVTEVFAAYTAMIAAALRKIGIEAEASGRNDITIGGKKVSGNAFYHLPGRSIAHGTMLYDFDPTQLANAITPSRAKLESKGVKSAPMRVTSLLREGIILSPAEFEKYMISEITDGNPYIVTPDDMRRIEEIEKAYYSPDFLRIHTDRSDAYDSSIRHSGRTRIDGLGEICIEYDLDPSDSTIHNFAITGDFFMHDDVDDRICTPLEGTPAEPTALHSRIEAIRPEATIPGLTPALLASLILP